MTTTLTMLKTNKFLLPGKRSPRSVVELPRKRFRLAGSIYRFKPVEPVEPPASEATPPLSPPSPPVPPSQSLYLFRSLYRDSFDRAIRTIKFASRKQVPQIPPSKVSIDKSKGQTTTTTSTTVTIDKTTSTKTIHRYFEMATALAKSLRDSSILFNQANASFVSAQTRSLYSRFLRLKVVAAFVHPSKRGKAGSLMVGVEVIEGSAVGDNPQEEDDEIELRSNQMTIAEYPLPARGRPRLHLRGCSNYLPDESSSLPPPPSSPSEAEDHQQILSSLPSPILPPELHHNSTSTTTFFTNTSRQQYPDNALFPVGARLLLIYGRCPLEPEYFKPGVTLMRLYPHWSAVHCSRGIRACCNTYHTFVLDGYNFAFEGVIS